jgi:hypothetical protein
MSSLSVLVALTSANLANERLQEFGRLGIQAEHMACEPIALVIASINRSDGNGCSSYFKLLKNTILFVIASGTEV